MSESRWTKVRNRTLTALAAVGLVAATLTIAAPAPVQAAPDPVQDRTYKDGNYLVMLVDTPAGAYPGGMKGYPATRPAPGKKFDATSAAAVKYRGFLKAKHNRLLNKVGAESYYDYTVALNGFAAHLTAKQATTLAKMPGVLAVTPDAIRKPDR